MSQLKELQKMLESAEASLKNAKRLLLDLDPGSFPKGSSPRSTSAYAADVPGGKVIEGAFNGEAMIAPDGEVFPVPANYASKSKLVAGDHLKLTIAPDGRFIYKQIGPVPRKTLIGTLVHEDGQFRIVADGKHFKVLLASVTYYKGHVGDRVTIIIADAGDSEWATIEAVLPKNVSDLNIHEQHAEDEEEVHF